MVTILNKDSSKELWDKYSKLFAKAFNELKTIEGALSAEELALGHFQSLDQYFAHLGDLLQTNNPVYMMLPLDETPFYINANTRVISVPAEFVKCGAVKGDNYCEIATFIIDRYFDYKDLADASIAVQWINANKEEGISHIQLIDLESEPGKIRFGWPLTEDITKYSGQIQFAVRFFEADKENANKFNYLFNTLPSSLNIKDGLMVSNPISESKNHMEDFKNFIKNSQNPFYTIPASPFFTTHNGGIDLASTAALENDTLTLNAMAVANDLGEIDYTWYYASDENPSVATIVNENQDYEDVFMVQDSFIEVTEFPEKKGLAKYWVKTNSDESESYTLYTGEWPPEGVTLYQKIAQLTILEENENKKVNVTGDYWVEATNTIEKNTTNPVASTHCKLPAPKDIVYVDNLDPFKFLNNNSSVLLSTKTESNENYTYTWYKTVVSADGVPIFDEENILIDGIEASYAAVSPGWYKVNTSIVLNRKEKALDSNICKVVYNPASPTLKSLKFIIDNSGEGDSSIEGEYNVPLDSDLPFEFPDLAAGALVTLSVETGINTGEGESVDLYSDYLSYKWYVQETDGKRRELTEKDIADYGTLLTSKYALNGPQIQVRGFNDQVRVYSCVIENHLQGKTAFVDTSDYNGFIVK